MAELTAARGVDEPAAEAGHRRGRGGAALVLAGAGLFATVGTAQILGPDVPPAELAAARLLLAGALLVGVAVLAGQASGLRRAALQAPTWWAGIGQAAFNLCFLGAMREAGVAIGTLVAIGATPVLTGLATRRVSRSWVAATAVAVVGLSVLVLGQARASGADVIRPSLPGVLLALGASASYAVYIIAGNAMAGRRMRVEPYLAVAFTVAGLLTAPFLVGADLGWLGTAGGAGLVVYLAAVPTLLAYQLFNRGLRTVRPGTASTLGLAEPVIAAALAVLVLHEQLSVLGAFGAALVVAGLLLVVRAVDR